MNPKFPRTAPNCEAEQFLQLSNTTNHLAPVSLPAVAGQKANTAIRITRNVNLRTLSGAMQSSVQSQCLQILVKPTASTNKLCCQDHHYGNLEPKTNSNELHADTNYMLC
jgi:hypothetical protein